MWSSRPTTTSASVINFPLVYEHRSVCHNLHLSDNTGPRLSSARSLWSHRSFLPSLLRFQNARENCMYQLHKLTIWIRVLLEKLTVIQLAMKLITVFIRARRCSLPCARQNQSYYHIHTIYLPWTYSSIYS
jgi:hypothetical protein